MGVHAGIAASDVACCKRLGVHSQGQDHAAAIALLGQVDRKASQQLGVGLDMKEKAEYLARPVSGTDRRRAVRAAADPSAVHRFAHTPTPPTATDSHLHAYPWLLQTTGRA